LLCSPAGLEFSPFLLQPPKCHWVYYPHSELFFLDLFQVFTKIKKSYIELQCLLRKAVGLRCPFLRKNPQLSHHVYCSIGTNGRVCCLPIRMDEGWFSDTTSPIPIYLWYICH
jgi:hypothetical protein